MSYAELVGISRAVPGIESFVTPVFADSSGTYVVQRGERNRIESFDGISLDDEFQPLSVGIKSSIGDDCLHCFEIAQGAFAFAPARRLANFLSANENSWRHRAQTARAVQRFIADVERSPGSDPDRATVIQAFSAERRPAKHPEIEIDLSQASDLQPDSTKRILRGAGLLDAFDAGSRAELRLAVARFARELTFDAASLIVIVDDGATGGEFVLLDDRPMGFIEAYRHRWTSHHDPVMEHLKRQSVPLIWDQETYDRCGQVKLWQQQAKEGHSNGVSLALHLPGARSFLFGVDREAPMPKDSGELTRLVAAVQFFAVHVQEAAFRLLRPTPLSAQAVQLTPRELEALRWTMEGKTAWEVGAIMNISERTAVLHLQNLMRKLGSVNKHQAVLKAVRLGLL